MVRVGVGVTALQTGLARTYAPYSTLWHTASMRLPSGSKTKAA